MFLEIRYIILPDPHNLSVSGEILLGIPFLAPPNQNTSGHPSHKAFCFYIEILFPFLFSSTFRFKLRNILIQFKSIQILQSSFHLDKSTPHQQPHLRNIL
jgi:hypothetical protein